MLSCMPCCFTFVEPSILHVTWIFVRRAGRVGEREIHWQTQNASAAYSRAIILFVL